MKRLYTRLTDKERVVKRLLGEDDEVAHHLPGKGNKIVYLTAEEHREIHILERGMIR